jgi:hypothetical protein
MTTPPENRQLLNTELERLGRMPDSGLIDASEYTTETAKVLAATSPPG